MTAPRAVSRRARREGAATSKSAHLALRKQRAGPIRERLESWLDAQRERHPPKSPLGVAIRYTLGQCSAGRNYLFVGDVASGKSLVVLDSLVATCESRGINPFDYLADVLARVQDHPAKAIDQLPGRRLGRRGLSADAVSRDGDSGGASASAAVDDLALQRTVTRIADWPRREQLHDCTRWYSSIRVAWPPCRRPHGETRSSG
jgi:hypothetical protein